MIPFLICGTAFAPGNEYKSSITAYTEEIHHTGIYIQYQINLSRLEDVVVDALHPWGDSALTSLLSATNLFNESREHDIGSI
jgi:hypothetical protein